MVSAEGGGYTWSLNSQQNPLTPWPNDPVSDSPHDVLYLRDEDTGVLWSATAQPIRVAGATYKTTHGKGWTRFEHDANGIGLELIQCVPTTDPIKLSRLRLCNRSSRTRRLSVTGYVEWALGANGTTPAPNVITSRDDCVTTRHCRVGSVLRWTLAARCRRASSCRRTHRSTSSSCSAMRLMKPPHEP